MKELLAFFKLVASDGHGNPSSSRVIGMGIFAVLALSLAAITTVFLYRIATLDDQVNLSTITMALTKFDWIYMILAATALSLYGINIWQYLGTLRMGGMFGQMGGMYNPMNPYGQMGQMGGGMYNPYNRLPFNPLQPGGMINSLNPLSPLGPLAPMALVGQGGSPGTAGATIQTQQGQSVEPHTDPIPSRMHTAEAGVGSDD